MNKRIITSNIFVILMVIATAVALMWSLSIGVNSWKLFVGPLLVLVGAAGILFDNVKMQSEPK